MEFCSFLKDLADICQNHFRVALIAAEIKKSLNVEIDRKKMNVADIKNFFENDKVPANIIKKVAN